LTLTIQTTIINLLGGNMKIVEDYAQSKVEEDRRRTVLNMFENGFSAEDIVKCTNYKLSFVKEVLSE